MLTLRIVQSRASILAACDEQRTTRGVRNLFYCLLELVHLVGHACFLNVEDAHVSGGKTARENVKIGVCCNTDWLVYFRHKLYGLLVGLHVEKSDCHVIGDRDDQV